jgi:hypothetical protein
MNLSGVTYYSAEQPFLDIFKTAATSNNSSAPNAGWITQSSNAWDTGEEQFIALDANGWPTSLTAVGESNQKFNSLVVLLLRGLDTYPAGNYVALYQGAGTLGFGFDGKVVSSSTTSPCSGFPAGTTRVIVNVATPSSGGIFAQISATDPNKTGDYIRNIQFVYAPTSSATVCDRNEQALENGSIFNPTFISKIQPFGILRFMDWMNTNGSPKYNWNNRPLPSNAFWSTTFGVPMEIMVDLLNTTGANGWFNMPTYANNTYVTNFANYVHQSLGANQKVYLEYTNEAWNGATGLPSQMQALGAAMWPSQPVNFSMGQNYYGMQAALNCQAWKTAWGADSARVICVMGNQAGNSGVASTALNCPYWAKGPCSTNYGIGAIADTAYFGPTDTPPSSWLNQSDGGQAELCSAYTSGTDPGAPSGYIASTLSAIAGDYATFSKMGLPIVGYEGGPVTQASDSAFAPLYLSFRQSSCMTTVYTAFLQQLQAQGYMQMLNSFNDAGNYTENAAASYGVWGALDNIWQTSSPVYEALTQFISTNPTRP